MGAQEFRVAGRGGDEAVDIGGIDCLFHGGDVSTTDDMLLAHHRRRAEAGHLRLQGREEDVLFLAVMTTVREGADDLDGQPGEAVRDARVARRLGRHALQAGDDLEDDAVFTGEDADRAGASEVDRREMIVTGHGGDPGVACWHLCTLQANTFVVLHQ